MLNNDYFYSLGETILDNEVFESASDVINTFTTANPQEV